MTEDFRITIKNPKFYYSYLTSNIKVKLVRSFMEYGLWSSVKTNSINKSNAKRLNQIRFPRYKNNFSANLEKYVFIQFWLHLSSCESFNIL